MQQHVYCLSYVSFVLVMYSLPGLVLYCTRPGKEYENVKIVGYINTNKPDVVFNTMERHRISTVR